MPIRDKTGNLVKKSAKKVGDFVEKEKENLCINIQNSSAICIVVKWLFTNKVSVILFIMVLFFVGKSYYIEYEYLRERNKTLILEKEEFLNKTKELEDTISKLKSDLKTAEKLNIKVREEAKGLTTEQKKERILKQIENLKKERGIK